MVISVLFQRESLNWYVQQLHKYPQNKSSNIEKTRREIPDMGHSQKYKRDKPDYRAPNSSTLDN